jgi:transcriptional regulator with XRE-family HTH domain
MSSVSPEASEQSEDRPAAELGDALRNARELTGLSLRKAADSASVSAAYLSQLEAGTVKDPSPRFLYELAKVYAKPDKMPLDELYADFMRKAGYVVPRQVGAGTGKTRTAVEMALSTTSPLSPDEQQAVAEYLAWYRSRHGRAVERRQ